VIEEFKEPRAVQVVAPEYVYLVTDVLADNPARVPAFGNPNPLTLPNNRPVAAKTGTTDDNRDNWALGYTPDLVAGVWVGNANNAPMLGSTGAMTSAPIWQGFMRRALEGTPVSQFRVPANVVRACANAQGLPMEGNTSCARPEVYVRGKLPTRAAATAEFELVKVKIDKRNGMLAADDTPAEHVEEKAFINIPGSTTAAVIEWARANNYELGSPPTERSPLGREAPRPTPTPSANVNQPPPSSAPGQACTAVCTVPNVVGLPEAEGKRRLEQAGFSTSYSNYQKESDVANKEAYRSVPQGAILSQSPAGGQSAPRGTLVNVAVRAE
jgi:membrane peptidoglycan carboxypeptidase